MSGLTINNNLMAMTAARNLGATYGSLSKSINKLSSGLRINSSADDAAGLAVRESMRSEVAVLNQGVRNANDAISMLQTMDGAAQVIDEKLIRMKELAEQSATGTYNDDQRSIMNDEFSAMRDEIDRIAQATDFNGIKMLNTTSGGVTQVVSLYGSGNTATSAGYAAENIFGRFVSGDTMLVHFTGKDGTEGFANIAMTDSVTISALAASINAIAGFGGTAAWTSAPGVSLIVTATSAGASQFDVELLKVGSASYSGTVTTAGIGGQVKIHFGTGNNSDEDYYYVNNQDMTSTGLGIDALNISTQHSAQAALEVINDAITAKDTGRAHFGAMMNRLSNTVTNLTVQSENIQAAESQISDVDVATEMTKFTNLQIKSQAAVAMLAQANSLPRMALSLLGG